MSILSKRGAGGMTMGGQSPITLKPSSRARKDSLFKKSISSKEQKRQQENDDIEDDNQQLLLSENLQRQESELSGKSPTVPKSAVEQHKDKEGEQLSLMDSTMQTMIGNTENEELMYRLMIDELNTERKHDERIHELIVELPEWQDYNNEVLRTLRQIEIDFHAYQGPSSWISYDHFEQRRIREVEDIRRKHYKRVSNAVEERMKLFDKEMDNDWRNDIDEFMAEHNLTEQELRNDPEFAPIFRTFDGNQEGEVDEFDQDEINEKLDELAHDKDEFDMELGEALGDESHLLEASDIPEEARVLFHKVTKTQYKRKDLKMEHEFSMEPTGLKSKSASRDDGDFNLKDILNNMDK
ncbi:hypothetical protein SAMD00019534_112930 [Acytostelium subglobosum LB1]|uniref:hypothetical protein n=1 Tax=Acytostelium subglobosum LB1 TaxID=1410327 RepID=UPI0006447E25|nr:hypothetical protein SAMD00019534_112930 [Acytostelium subglobosum LB1]GAM28117.1 hypothetical protein SAMD00019534_112930 [Acytostelium subglobosum LB1]|eukprot:XP_012749076.1 hypothetical protein SAMD00019534_112930 [Acytostelium subglobosum LB1]